MFLVCKEKYPTRFVFVSDAIVVVSLVSQRLDNSLFVFNLRMVFIAVTVSMVFMSSMTVSRFVGEGCTHVNLP